MGSIFTQKRRGFTLIESLVLVFVVSVGVMVFYRTYTLAMRYAIDAKHRTAAVEFATEEMEILRNTPYEDVVLDPATNPPTGNVISGVSGKGLAYTDVRSVNDVPHRITREIHYVNDEEDGTSGDSVPQDYKKVVITVFWGNGVNDTTDTVHSITLSSFFVPPSGNESAVVNGALSINVVSSDGMVVSSANVGIVRASDGSSVPGYPNPLTTSSIGNALFLGLSSGSYKVTVAKSGFETIQTMNTTSTFAPVYAHASVLPGVITTLTIIMDQLPNATFHTVDQFGNALSGMHVVLSGGRTLGINGGGIPVHVNENIAAISNASGNISCNTVSGYKPSIGLYILQLNETNYLLWKERDTATCSSFDTCNICVENPNAMRDAINNTSEMTSGTFNSDLIIVNKTVDGIFLKVTDGATGGPMESASVEVKNDTEGYDYTRTTDRYGMVYFPVKNKEDNSEGTACEIVPLENGKDYDVTITADGYDTHTQSVTVSGLEEVEVTMDVL